MTRPPKNVAASVRARLAQRARDRGDDFQLNLTRYAWPDESNDGARRSNDMAASRLFGEKAILNFPQ